MVKLGILGAMELEVEQLTAAMESPTLTQQAGMKFYSGKLEGTDAVVVRSGVGKVNAAVCAQILADRFGVQAIIIRLMVIIQLLVINLWIMAAK